MRLDESLYKFHRLLNVSGLICTSRKTLKELVGIYSARRIIGAHEYYCPRSIRY